MLRGHIIGDRYRLLDRIGEGGMATIYLALDEKLGRKVALKLLHKHLCENKDVRLRFQQEAQAISSLDHPNIVKIYDFSGSDSEQLWIVTEVIKGQNLAEYSEGFSHRRLHPALATLIIREVCKALSASHQAGIVHRDIKPENLMFTQLGSIKLMDFGIAKDTHNHSMTQTGTFMGSPSYMSPEQVRGKDIDQRTDLYSLGIVFYELITGRIPFVGNTMHEVILRIMEASFTPPHMIIQNLPKEFSELIGKCLEKNPTQRFANADQMGEALDSILHLYRLEESHVELERFVRSKKDFFAKLPNFDSASSQSTMEHQQIKAIQMHNQNALDQTLATTVFAPSSPVFAQENKPNPIIQKIIPPAAHKVAAPKISNGQIPPRKDRQIPSHRLPHPPVKASRPNPKRPQISPNQMGDNFPVMYKEARSMPTMRSWSRRTRFKIQQSLESTSVQSAVGFVLFGIVLVLFVLALAQYVRKSQEENTIENSKSTVASKPINKNSTTPTRETTLIDSSKKINLPINQEPQSSSAKTSDSINTESGIVIQKQNKQNPSRPNTARTPNLNTASESLPKSSVVKNPVATNNNPQTNAQPNSDHTQLASDIRKGFIRISSEPASEIFLNGEKVGNTNDAGVSSGWIEVPTGMLTLQLRRQGFQSYNYSLKIQASERKQLQNVRLLPSQRLPLNLVFAQTPVSVEISSVDQGYKFKQLVFSQQLRLELNPNLYDVKLDANGQTLKRRIQLPSPAGGGVQIQFGFAKPRNNKNPPMSGGAP